ncbi:MAG: DeoR/GlpR transcriptional regulator [Kiritimatiellae bacterium]|nr:DeoR/GlpR transcriptional regulator [Kiritimatiellia bacterium]
MLAIDRQRKIEAMVVRTGSVRVDALAHSFSVARETIRRDLAKLEAVGLVKRSHGGAVRVAGNDYALTFSERRIINIEEKRAIASEAIKFVEEGDSIILDASTTTWQMAKLLPDIPLTVITNSIKVIVEFVRCKNIHVIGVGGEFSGSYLAFVGSRAEQAVMGYHVNKVFMSCSGCDLGYGLSDTNELQAELKRKMLQAADMKYLLVDHSKMGIRNLINITKVDTFDHMIIDRALSEEDDVILKERDVEVHIAGSIGA